MTKKPRVKKRAVRKPDKYDRVARKAFTPGGASAPVDRLLSARCERGGFPVPTGASWSVECFADFLRRELSTPRTK